MILSRPVLAVLAAVVIAVISGLTVGRVRFYALKHAMLDVPNARSLHSAPTPRGGGIAIAGAIVLSAIVAAVTGHLGYRIAIALAGSAGVLAAIGWMDDRVSLSPRLRLVVQGGAATWAVLWIGGFPTIWIGRSELVLGHIGSALAVVGLVWMTNLYNFMDGVDGIAGLTAALTAASGTIVLAASNADGLAIVCLAIVGSSLGLLYWNWPPARIFMGDVGSGVLGFSFGFIALAAERTAATSFVPLILPLGFFTVDATFTVLRRLARRERIYEAHRTHIYQRLVKNGWSHRRVTLLVGAVTAALAVLGALGLGRPHVHPFLVAGFVLLPAVAGGTALVLSSRNGDLMRST